MADGLVVRVSTDVTAGYGFALYAVACSVSAEAIEAVRAVLPAEWRIKGAVGPLSEETIRRLDLAPGEARLL